MKFEFNTEEFMETKLKHYATIATILFIIIAILLTFKCLFISKNVITWFLGIIILCGICVGYVFLMLKIVSKKEPVIIITDTTIYCNFKQVPTKHGSLKRKFIGTYESIMEDCELSAITHYEITNKYIIAYGYEATNLHELTGFVVERFFDEDDEVLITTWLQNHISNIHNSNIRYLNI